MNTSISSEHSSFIGGSNCARRVNCPASYQMEQKLPVSAKDESSDYADEGSALHAAMAYILNEDLPAEAVLDMRFPGYERFPITQELIDTAIKPCIDYFNGLDDEAGGLSFYVEKRVAVRSMPGVFGTVDVVGRGEYGSVILDWKFGIGVEVLAWYEDDDGTIVANEQPMLYTLATLETHPEMFDDDPDWPVTLVIAQPRWRDGENFDSITVTVKDILAFKDKLMAAAALATSDNPPISKGSWCRFAPCKSICPLHVGPLFDAARLAELQAAVDGGGRTEETAIAVDWGKTYAHMLDLAARIEPVIREWRTQAQTWLEEGNAIPGYKLVGKRATRKWSRPDASVERKLYKLGLSKDERMPRALVTAPQAEKLLKARGHSLPDGYFAAVSSGLTLAADSDSRHAVEPVRNVIAALTHALSALGAARTEEEENQT